MRSKTCTPSVCDGGAWDVGAGAGTHLKGFLLTAERKQRGFKRRRRRILQGFQSLRGSLRSGSSSVVPGTSMGFFGPLLYSPEHVA